MKRIILLTIILVFTACSDAVDKPKDLLGKDKMSEIIADFAVTDQMGMLNQKGNMETETRFILKKHNATAKQFSDSYEFYLSKPATLEKIFDNAQDIIKEKDPDAAKFIEKKLEPIKDKNIPSFAK